MSIGSKRVWKIIKLSNQRKNRRENPEHHKALREVRRGREKAAPGSFTPMEWLELIRLQGGRCFDCSRMAKLTVGHLVPLSRGGSNDITNIVGQCAPCNSRQGAKIHQSIQREQAEPEPQAA